MPFYDRPVVRRKDHKSNPALPHILLVFEIEIGGDKDVKQSGFGGFKQLAVFQTSPSASGYRLGLMLEQMVTQLHRKVFVEQYPHLAELVVRLWRGRLGEGKDFPDRFLRYGWIVFVDVFHALPQLGFLDNRIGQNARTFDERQSGHLARYLFDQIAAGPVHDQPPFRVLTLNTIVP